MVEFLALLRSVLVQEVNCLSQLPNSFKKNEDYMSSNGDVKNNTLEVKALN